jgi:DNA-binding PadR family transcriptional regulator
MSQSLGKIPRGFTRYYVLYLLSENELTGKDIIDESIRRSEGDWSPSPGLIYPLLGRLVRDGMIAELDGGKFTITELGHKELKKKDKFQEELEGQLTLVNKLGLSMFTAGKFFAEEAIEQISRISSTAWDKLTNRSDDTQRRFEEKYEQFLLEELERLKRKKTMISSVSEELK